MELKKKHPLTRYRPSTCNMFDAGIAFVPRSSFFMSMVPRLSDNQVGFCSLQKMAYT